MSTLGTLALTAGAALSACAAIAHLACVAIGPAAYRFMGAGEKMVRAAAVGKLVPTVVTLGIALVLFIWAAYALSGAGLIGPLPFTKAALFVITAVYLARALAFPLLRPAFAENSATFWWVSSGICLAIGLLHVVGLWAAVL